ncbi:hypothetical protein J8273_7036 [Carpediemonas membranifera]|uniref:Uncharacterized protein n=1 Tax=Carpediemonas membranifera TaxID=201153 RepID=A0A8J6AXG4_9EUKA|nr:hypothetical protein J8273_7036 [Carpediemonas membranifera]|eukprot:KAG9390783.1 hypothetical protein J8273_7036 [Carpediemonas membranifera]
MDASCDKGHDHASYGQKKVAADDVERERDDESEVTSLLGDGSSCSVEADSLATDHADVIQPHSLKRTANENPELERNGNASSSGVEEQRNDASARYPSPVQPPPANNHIFSRVITMRPIPAGLFRGAGRPDPPELQPDPPRPEIESLRALSPHGKNAEGHMKHQAGMEGPEEPDIEADAIKQANKAQLRARALKQGRLEAATAVLTRLHTAGRPTDSETLLSGRVKLPTVLNAELPSPLDYKPRKKETAKDRNARTAARRMVLEQDVALLRTEAENLDCDISRHLCRICVTVGKPLHPSEPRTDPEDDETELETESRLWWENGSLRGKLAGYDHALRILGADALPAVPDDLGDVVEDSEVNAQNGKLAVLLEEREAELDRVLDTMLSPQEAVEEEDQAVGKHSDISHDDDDDVEQEKGDSSDQDAASDLESPAKAASPPPAPRHPITRESISPLFPGIRAAFARSQSIPWIVYDSLTKPDTEGEVTSEIDLLTHKAALMKHCSCFKGLLDALKIILATLQPKARATPWDTMSEDYIAWRAAVEEAELSRALVSLVQDKTGPTDGSKEEMAAEAESYDNMVTPEWLRGQLAAFDAVIFLARSGPLSSVPENPARWADALSQRVSTFERTFRPRAKRQMPRQPSPLDRVGSMQSVSFDVPPPPELVVPRKARITDLLARKETLMKEFAAKAARLTASQEIHAMFVERGYCPEYKYYTMPEVGIPTMLDFEVIEDGCPSRIRRASRDKGEKKTKILRYHLAALHNVGLALDQHLTVVEGLMAGHRQKELGRVPDYSRPDFEFMEHPIAHRATAMAKAREVQFGNRLLNQQLRGRIAAFDAALALYDVTLDELPDAPIRPEVEVTEENAESAKYGKTSERIRKQISRRRGRAVEAENAALIDQNEMLEGILAVRVSTLEQALVRPPIRQVVHSPAGDQPVHKWRGNEREGVGLKPLAFEFGAYALEVKRARHEEVEDSPKFIDFFEIAAKRGAGEQEEVSDDVIAILVGMHDQSQ